jgi:hypothetical protein
VEAVGVITGREGWCEAVQDRCERTNLPFECWSWGNTPVAQGRPYRVLLADVTRAVDPVVAELGGFAEHAWQACTVVSVTGSPGAADLVRELRRLGFRRIVMERNRHTYWATLRRHIETVRRGDGWLLPVFCRVLPCSDARIRRAVATLLDPLPCGRTVTRWARHAGFRRRQELAALCCDAGLPPPKTMLDAIRLARATHAARMRPGLTRDQLAQRFGFSSGDYLGKRARALTGQSFGRLIRVGPAAVLAHAVAAA